MVNNGSWQNGANWDTNPVFPNNSGGDTFVVTLPNGRNVDLDADVLISDLATEGGVVFNNASGRQLTVERKLDHSSGTFTVQSSLLLTLQGESTFSGGSLDLRNGARLRNQGELVFGPGTTFEGSKTILPTPLPAGPSADFVNDGITRVNTKAGVTLQNFTTSNTGSLVVNQGKFESTAAIFQEEAGASLVVAEGAELKSNGLNLLRGMVQGNGTYNGSSFVLGDGTSGATVEPGLAVGQTGVLKFDGNMGMVSGATLVFDLNGPVVGTDCDQLIVPNGMDLTGVTLALRVGPEVTEDDEFDLITGNNLRGSFANDSGKRIEAPAGSFAVDYQHTYVRLYDFQAIPEPSSVAGAASLGLAGFAAWRRVCPRRPA